MKPAPAKRPRRTRRPAAVPPEPLAALLDRVSDGIVVLDADWRYRFVNSAGAAMFGRKPADLLGRHIWTEFPEGRGQPFHLAYERAMATQQPIVLEDYYAPWDRWFENRIYPSPDALTILYHDITDRKRAELELRRERDLTASVMEASPTGIAIIERDGRISYANARAEEILFQSPRRGEGLIDGTDRERDHDASDDPDRERSARLRLGQDGADLRSYGQESDDCGEVQGVGREAESAIGPDCESLDPEEHDVDGEGGAEGKESDSGYRLPHRVGRGEPEREEEKHGAVKRDSDGRHREAPDRGVLRARYLFAAALLPGAAKPLNRCGPHAVVVEEQEPREESTGASEEDGEGKAISAHSGRSLCHDGKRPWYRICRITTDRSSEIEAPFPTRQATSLPSSFPASNATVS